MAARHSTVTQIRNQRLRVDVTCQPANTTLVAIFLHFRLQLIFVRCNDSLYFLKINVKKHVALVIDESCQDTSSLKHCLIVVEKQLCEHSFYEKPCCRSCAIERMRANATSLPADLVKFL